MKIILALVFAMVCGSSMALTTNTVECQYNNSMDTMAFTTVEDRFQTERDHGGYRVKVSVANINQPSEADDYISFSRDNKTMTYPLNCKKM